MVEEYLKYIDKQDCERKGLVRTADGKYYKLNTLERYEAKGYLDGEKYDSQQLLGAGLRLAKDFYLSRLAVVSANDVSKVRVDGCGNSNTSDNILFALDRFHDACRAVPYEFWSVVSGVCCDDIDVLKNIKGSSERQNTQQRVLLMALLRMGLARLVEHYR